VFFARNGLKVRAIDFSAVSIAQLSDSIANSGLEKRVRISQVDLSRDLPRIASREVIDGVYSNLFYCMPFSDEILQKLFDFVCHTLREGGLQVFSFRNKKKDKSFGKGREIAKDTFEINGFRVRFFTHEEILRFNHGFKTTLVKDVYEEPCSLTLVFAVRA
jgi:cyclopropane fatty-acyl-phospholipid synthase-like methyltransferase